MRAGFQPCPLDQRFGRQRRAGNDIGVARGFFTGHERVDAVIEEALRTLKSLGAVIVDPVDVPPAERYGAAEFEVLLTECRHGVDAYLAEKAAGTL